MKITLYILLSLSGTVLMADNTVITSCPATEWKAESIVFEKKFTKDSETDIPAVKVLADSKITSTFFWQEQAIVLDGNKKVHRLKDPGLVYTTATVSADWSGITFQLLISLEGHSNTDFMRVDGVKVGQTEFLFAQNNPAPNPPKAQTNVGGSNVYWVWRERDPILTRIEKEGNEIELQHSSNEIEVLEVTNVDGSEAAVVSEDGNTVIYPGNFASRLNMNHKVTVNCP